jgi:hypothetical protein
MAKSHPMKKGNLPAATRRNFDYPTETNGSRLAQRVRAQANRISETDRAALFKQGMQVIYGGSGTKEKVGGR